MLTTCVAVRCHNCNGKGHSHVMDFLLSWSIELNAWLLTEGFQVQKVNKHVVINSTQVS